MNLKIDYAQLRTLSANVGNKAGEFNNLLGKITSANETLKSSWQGADANKYTDAVTDQANTMKKLYEAIEQVGEYLGKVADAYQAANEANQQGINMN